jgi:hypothetical protein
MAQSVDDSFTGTTAGAAAVEIAADMAPRAQYRITAKGAPLWFSVVAPGGTAASIGGATSHFLFTGESVPVAAIGTARTRVSIIRDTATDVTAIVSRVVNVQGF